MKEVNWVMHPSNSSKSGSDIDEAHDNVYIHLDRSNNAKQIVNYTPLHERDSYTHVSNLTSNQFYFACMIFFNFICTFILLMLSGDIESNPG
jgi:hypothetical protein